MLQYNIQWLAGGGRVGVGDTEREREREREGEAREVKEPGGD